MKIIVVSKEKKMFLERKKKVYFNRAVLLVRPH